MHKLLLALVMEVLPCFLGAMNEYSTPFTLRNVESSRTAHSQAEPGHVDEAAVNTVNERPSIGVHLRIPRGCCRPTPNRSLGPDLQGEPPGPIRQAHWQWPSVIVAP